MKRVLVIGRHVTEESADYLIHKGPFRLSFVGLPDLELFRELLDSFKPDAIIFMEMLYEQEAVAQPKMLEHIQSIRTPTLIIGPLSWQRYTRTRNLYTYFASACSNQDMAEWVRHVC